MRITKELANNIARGLLKTKTDEISEFSKSIREYATEIYKRQIPENVLKLFKSNKEYINTSCSVRLIGNGFNYDYQAIDELPSTLTHPHLVFTNEEAEKLLSMRYRLEALKKDREELKKEVEQTLISLGTYKRVSENFPEAIPFLPKVKNAEIVVDLTKLREKIK